MSSSICCVYYCFLTLKSSFFVDIKWQVPKEADEGLVRVNDWFVTMQKYSGPWVKVIGQTPLSACKLMWTVQQLSDPVGVGPTEFGIGIASKYPNPYTNPVIVAASVNAKQTPPTAVDNQFSNFIEMVRLRQNEYITVCCDLEQKTITFQEYDQHQRPKQYLTMLLHVPNMEYYYPCVFVGYYPQSLRLVRTIPPLQKWSFKVTPDILRDPTICPPEPQKQGALIYPVRKTFTWNHTTAMYPPANGWL
jgi:hypothetical protein